MKLSIVIPAYNEEKLLPRCLTSIEIAVDACKARSVLGEVIVVDNNSSDRTANIAREGGARVVFEAVNQISRARNAGAREATGDWLLFIDADSVLSAACLADLLACIRDDDCAGGGCRVGFLDSPPSGRLAMGVWNCISRLMRWAAGSFVFCRADAFAGIGGFSCEVYAAEEIFFCNALKRWAREHDLQVRILSDHVHLSSPRKIHLYSLGENLSLVARAVVSPFSTVKDKKGLDYFYDGRR